MKVISNTDIREMQDILQRLLKRYFLEDAWCLTSEVDLEDSFAWHEFLKLVDKGRD